MNWPTSSARSPASASAAPTASLPSGQRLGEVAAHPRAGRPARHVLDRRVHRGVPPAHPGAEEDPARGPVAGEVRGEPGRPHVLLAQRGSGQRDARPGDVRRHASGSAARVPPVSRTRGRVYAPAHALEEHRGGRHRHHPDGVGAAGQPAREVDQRRADPAQPQVTPCRAHSRSSTARSTSSAGSWMPGGGPPGTRSASRTATNRASAVAASGVDHQQPAGPEQPARLGEGGGQVRDVLEDLAGRDHVRAAVGQRHRRDVGAHRVDTVRRRPGRARWP